MEVSVNVELNYQELWALLESLPESKTALYGKLSALRVPFERRYQIYGNGATIKPLAVVNDYHNKDAV